MGLDRRDTKALLLGLLGGAMPADYKVRFLMENASATLEAEDRRLLQSVFRDNIEFDATGLTRFDLIKSCGFVEKGGHSTLPTTANTPLANYNLQPDCNQKTKPLQPTCKGFSFSAAPKQKPSSPATRQKMRVSFFNSAR